MRSSANLGGKRASGAVQDGAETQAAKHIYAVPATSLSPRRGPRTCTLEPSGRGLCGARADLFAVTEPLKVWEEIQIGGHRESEGESERAREISVRAEGERKSKVGHVPQAVPLDVRIE